MIIGVMGNITVIIHTIFTSKEKTATSYLVGNLALADLLVCITFYPIWITEFMMTLLNIDSDQELFCKLSRSCISAFMFASLAALLALTVDRYFYIVKALRYPLIVTKRRVFVAVSLIWLATSCLLIVSLIYNEKDVRRLRSYCYLKNNVYYVTLFLKAKCLDFNRCRAAAKTYRDRNVDLSNHRLRRKTSHEDKGRKSILSCS
jgi:hypothetical protein